MQINLLAPFCVSYLSFAAVLILVTSVGEGNLPKSKQRSEGYTPVSTQDNDGPIVAANQATTDSPATPLHKSPDSDADGQSTLANIRSEMEELFSLFGTPATSYCLAAMFLKRVAFASSVFAPQYVSEKFKWSLHETTWLRVSASGAAILIYLVAPPLNAWLIRRGSLPQRVDMTTIRGSLSVLAISFFAAWRAKSGVSMIIGISSKSKIK